MNNRSTSTTIFWLIVVIIVVAIGAYFIWGTGPGTASNTATTTPTGTTTGTEGTQQTLVTPGGLSIPYNTGTWSLAAAPEGVLSQSYIPPCDQGYQYCFYMGSSTYPGTNFESAGIRVNARPDLTTASTCLNTQPAGYTGLKPTTGNGNGYSVSAFSPLGDAAAGHYSTGALYRLYFGTTCYEFQTRIGQSQFANYPAGTIQQFTAADQAAIATAFVHFLDGITIASSGASIDFPQVTLTQQAAR